MPCYLNGKSIKCCSGEKEIENTPEKFLINSKCIPND